MFTTDEAMKKKRTTFAVSDGKQREVFPGFLLFFIKGKGVLSAARRMVIVSDKNKMQMIHSDEEEN